MSLDFSTIHGFLLDLDGTLYLGPNLFPGTPLLIKKLEETSKRKVFLTNNSFHSTDEYFHKLNNFKLARSPEEILTSGWATIYYILNSTPYRKIHLLGSPALKDEFMQAGLEITNPSLKGIPESEPEAVVLGFDRHFTYPSLRAASRYLLNGLPYVATHPDKVCPTEDLPIPDTGALIEYFDAVTGRRPVVIGKPHQTMIDAALNRLGTAAEHTAIVGDRLYTDMKMGINGGLKSILVLSGETKMEDVPQSEIQPDHIVNDVGELTNLLF